MKFFPVCIALIFLFPSIPAVGQGDRIDWQADLEFLSDELTAKHPDAFHLISENEFTEKVDALAARIPSMDRTEATLELMQLVASLGDAHTTVIPDYTSFRFIPINVRWFEEGVFVRAIERSHKDMIGARVTGVGSLSMEELEAKFASLISHDNAWGIRKMMDLQFQTYEYLSFIGATNENETVSVHFEKDGKESTIEFKPIDSRGAKSIKFVNPWSAGLMKQSVYLDLLMKDEKGLPFWNEWLADQKTVYFKYNRCVQPNAFNELVKGTAGFISSNDVDKFVLDLRDNSGGSSLVFKPLLNYLKSNEDLNQKGKLFVIVGRKTFSSGIFAACEMRKTNAIFVGEPTSGKPNHFGEVKSFQLPSSKLMVQHSTKQFILGDDSEGTFMPELRIEYRADETLSAEDLALKTIFNY
jgi:hypothetical protein